MIEGMDEVWLNKNRYNLEVAWMVWRDATIHLPQELAEKHELYKEVEKYRKILDYDKRKLQ